MTKYHFKSNFEGFKRLYGKLFAWTFWILALSCALPFVSAKVSPKILQKIQGISEITELPRGKRFQIMCTASEGDLPLTFRWMRNGQSLASSSEVIVRRIDDHSSSLAIDSVTEYHSGNYSCVVSNAAGMDSYTALLQVNVAPFWIHQPVDSMVVIGADLVLSCEAGGFPSPKITWKKSKSILSQSSQDIHSSGRFRISETGLLTILRSEKDDSGYYTCEASNRVDGNLVKTAKVEVLVPPQMATKFQLSNQRKGQDVHLTCEVTGDQPMTVTWWKASERLDVSSEARLSVTDKESSMSLASILEISHSKASDSSLYKCLAENSRGRGETQFRLVIVEPPGKVEGISLLTVWSRSIRLGWKLGYNGNSPITKVIIECQESSDDESIHQSVRPTESSAILKDLSPWTTYKVWLRAENEIGLGDPSTVLVFTTNEEEPSKAPPYFKVDSVRATTAKVSWQALKPENWNGQPKGYYLGYSKESHLEHKFLYRTILVAVKSNATQHSYLVTGLQRSTGYVLVIAAFNNAGVGPQSETISLRTKSGVPPNTPTMMMLPSKGNNLELEIRQDSGDDEVTDYLIHLKTKNSGWVEIPMLTNSQRRYKVGGFVRDTPYQVFITARNSFGTSEPTDVHRFKIDHQPGLSSDDDDRPLYMKPQVMLPVAASALLVFVVCIVVHCLLKRHGGSNKRPRKKDGIVADDFTYCAPASCQRSESGYYPPLRASLPRGSGSSQAALVGTGCRSLYNEPRNYSPCTEDSDEPKYEYVVEEMRTFMNVPSGSYKKSIKQAVPT